MNNIEIINGIKFDQRNGIGAVPWNQDVGYRGFIKYMTPDEFLSLVPQYSDKTWGISDYISAIKKNGIASPFLQVELEGDMWKVRGHEGRHRMTALKTINPHIQVPVHILPDNMRARNITSDMENYDFIPEKKNYEESYKGVLSKILKKKTMTKETVVESKYRQLMMDII